MPLALQTPTAPVIDTRLAALEARMSHFLPPDHDEIRALLADADRLARSDALEASHLRGRIHTLTGDRPQVDYWFANARRLHDDWRAAFNHASCLASLGYFSDAASYSARFLDVDERTLAKTVPLAVTVMDLMGAARAYRRLADAGIRPLGPNPDFALTAMDVLDEFDVPLARTRSMLDIVGEVVREARIWWLGPGPRCSAIRTDEDLGASYELRIAVDTMEAVRLTNVVELRLLERQHLLHGFCFSFIGMGERPSIAPKPLQLRRVQ